MGATVWANVVGWVRQESAATTALVQAFIALGIAFEWWHWTPAQTGAVIGIVAALLGMFVRSQVTPIHRLRPRAGQPGAPGPGADAALPEEPDSGIRVLPGTGAQAGPATRPMTRPDINPGGGPGTGPGHSPGPGPGGGLAGGPDPGPDDGPGTGLAGGPGTGPGRTPGPGLAGGPDRPPSTRP